MVWGLFHVCTSNSDCCASSPFLAAIIQQYVECGLGLEVNSETDNSIVK